MKILIACVLLSTLSLTFATPLSALLQGSLASEQSDEVKALLQTLTDIQNTDDGDDDDVGEDIANLQGVFNVLAQVNTEKAKVKGEDDAIAQLWGTIGRGLFHIGKRYLKNKYCKRCTEEQEKNALLQDLTSEQQGPDGEDNGDGEEKAMAELQSVFTALRKAAAEADLNADAEGWFKKLRRKFGKKLRRKFGKTFKRITKKYLC